MTVWSFLLLIYLRLHQGIVQITRNVSQVLPPQVAQLPLPLQPLYLPPPPLPHLLVPRDQQFLQPHVQHPQPVQANFVSPVSTLPASISDATPTVLAKLALLGRLLLSTLVMMVKVK